MEELSVKVTPIIYNHRPHQIEELAKFLYVHNTEYYATCVPDCFADAENWFYFLDKWKKEKEEENE